MKTSWSIALSLILPSCVCAKRLSHVRLFVVPQSVVCQAPLSMGILQARKLEWVSMPSSRGSSNSGTKPRSPALQADSLPSEPPGKSKNTGVCSQSLLQGNFLHQELNQGLLCLGMKAHPKTQMASSGMALNTDGIRFLCQLIGSCSPVPHISWMSYSQWSDLFSSLSGSYKNNWKDFYCQYRLTFKQISSKLVNTSCKGWGLEEGIFHESWGNLCWNHWTLDDG